MDFHLSEEIISMIPTDPYDEPDLARKITTMAISSRVAKYELMAGKLRKKLFEKEVIIANLREQIA